MTIVIEVIINKIKENKYTIIECSQLRENIFLTLWVNVFFSMLGTESVEFYSTSFSNPKNGFKPLTPMSDQDRISHSDKWWE